jgi:hypothetical protein
MAKPIPRPRRSFPRAPVPCCAAGHYKYSTLHWERQSGNTVLFTLVSAVRGGSSSGRVCAGWSCALLVCVRCLCDEIEAVVFSL